MTTTTKKIIRLLKKGQTRFQIAKKLGVLPMNVASVLRRYFKPEPTPACSACQQELKANSKGEFQGTCDPCDLKNIRVALRLAVIIRPHDEPLANVILRCCTSNQNYARLLS